MIPQIYDLGRHYKGDTFRGRTFQINITTNADTQPLDLSGASIKMQVKTNPNNSTAAKAFSIGNGISIINATNGHFKIDAFIIDLDALVYVYDIEITTSGGVITTYLKGTLIIEQDITN